ncbi:MAG: hypothetical protein ABWY56_11650, partial [Propionibacteriaceae bacterium]
MASAQVHRRATAWGPARSVRLVLALLAMVALALGFSAAGATRSFAAANDEIDSFAVKYDVQTSGTVRVQETITWRFGDNSG